MHALSCCTQMNSAGQHSNIMPAGLGLNPQCSNRRATASQVLSAGRWSARQAADLASQTQVRCAAAEAGVRVLPPQPPLLLLLTWCGLTAPSAACFYCPWASPSPSWAAPALHFLSFFLTVHSPVCTLRRRVPSIGPASCEDGACNRSRGWPSRPSSLPRGIPGVHVNPSKFWMEELFDKGAWLHREPPLIHWGDPLRPDLRGPSFALRI